MDKTKNVILIKHRHYSAFDKTPLLKTFYRGHEDDRHEWIWISYDVWVFYFAREHEIIMFKLSPHSTHRTRPLDVGLIQSFKNYHAEVIDETVRCETIDFNRDDFLAIFEDIHARAFTKKNICSAWKRTGPIPFDPKMVLDKLKHQRRSVTLPPKSTKLCSPLACTPRTAKEVIDHGEELRKTIYGHQLSSNCLLQINRFIKGAIAGANVRQLVERDLETIYKYLMAKAARTKERRTVV